MSWFFIVSAVSLLYFFKGLISCLGFIKQAEFGSVCFFSYLETYKCILTWNGSIQWILTVWLEHSILGDAAPVIMISPQAVNLNKSSEINGQWLHFLLCVCTCTCQIFIRLCAHKTYNNTLSLHTFASALLFAALSGLDLLHTHLTLNYWTGS